jgi:transposase
MIFVRELTETEREQLQKGLRSQDGFVLKRCQMVLASARGERAPAIAQNLGCSDDTVQKVINGFNAKGLEILEMGSRRPHKIQAAFSTKTAAKLKDMLHQSPRDFGKETSCWTLDLAAEVSFENGLIKERVSDETIRNTLKRLGVKWSRAKHWITSPDPEYMRKKNVETG